MYYKNVYINAREQELASLFNPAIEETLKELYTIVDESEIAYESFIRNESELEDIECSNFRIDAVQGGIAFVNALSTISQPSSMKLSSAQVPSSARQQLAPRSKLPDKVKIKIRHCGVCGKAASKCPGSGKRTLCKASDIEKLAFKNKQNKT